MINCKICGNTAQKLPNTVIDCSVCGQYMLSRKILGSDLERNSEKLYKVSSWIREQNDDFSKVPEIDLDKFDSLVEMEDKKIQEKFDLMMQFFAAKDKNYQLTNELLVKCWIKEYEEAVILYEKALNMGFVSGSVIRAMGGSSFLFNDLPYDGLEYIESLEEPNKSSKNIFVAFNFEEGLSEIFNTHVKQGIEELGFNYVVVNQNTTEHDKAISDEIIAKLKSSRIVIADFTNHRNSVYFEAGFAMGMKIPIIWTCQEGHTEDLSFDTRQYPHLVWNDGEDLKEQIMNRIMVIL